MNRRLDVLLRQRELLRQHLQWLDDEIAAAQTAEPAALGHEATPEPPHAPSAPATTTGIPLLEPVEPDSRGLHNEVRRGCLIYFSIALLLLAAVITFIYWRYDRDDTPSPPPAVDQSEPFSRLRSGADQGLH